MRTNSDGSGPEDTDLFRPPSTAASLRQPFPSGTCPGLETGSSPELLVTGTGAPCPAAAFADTDEAGAVIDGTAAAALWATVWRNSLVIIIFLPPDTKCTFVVTPSAASGIVPN